MRTYACVHCCLTLYVCVLYHRSAHAKALKKHEDHEGTVRDLERDYQEMKETAERFEEDFMRKSGQAVELQDAQVRVVSLLCAQQWRSYGTHTSKGPIVHTSRGPTVHTLVEILLYTH